MNKILSTLKGLYELLYPRLCMCCLEEKTAGDHTVFCLRCHSSFPFTDHFTNADNLLMHHFYGRVKVVKAASLMYFKEGSLVQQLLHNLKYKGMKAIGTDLGAMAADRMLHSGFYSHITGIVPVPMHVVKKKQRGYNQSEVIALKISEELNIPLMSDILIKNKSTVTQTHKGRQDRLENIKGSFTCRKNENLSGHHLLLIDDVATTGATLEACIQTLQEAGSPDISVFTVAIAE